MDSKMIEVIEHNWRAFDEVVRAPGDDVAAKALIACAELMDFDRYVPSVERISAEIGELEGDVEDALCALRKGGYLSTDRYSDWRLTDSGYEASCKARTACSYFEAIEDGGRDWKFDDCTVTMAPFDGELWMFHVSAPNGKTCDVLPDTISDAVECFGNLENGESPVWGGWEDGSGNPVSDLLADDKEAKAE